jgi:hypothetical protein
VHSQALAQRREAVAVDAVDRAVVAVQAVVPAAVVPVAVVLREGVAAADQRHRSVV